MRVTLCDNSAVAGVRRKEDNPRKIGRQTMLARLRTIALGSLGAGLAGAALLAPLPALAQTDEEPLARFEDALCPGVLGLKQEAAEQMVGRLRANAEMLGVRMAENGDCQANLVVGFVSDGQAFLSQLQDRSGYIFAEMTRDERLALLADTGPARAMLRIRARTRDGMPISRRENLAQLPTTTMWMAHSKIYSATRNDIISAMVLFDREAVRGLNLTQLADYATFRALAQRLPGPEAAGQASILTLFEPGEARPDGLTAFDRAYLGQLYAGLANLPAPAKLADLAQVTGMNAAE
jgi:hypothetical protein